MQNRGSFDIGRHGQTRRDRYGTSPTKKYMEIRRGITDQLLFDVAGILLEHPGMDKAITREELSMRLFGEFTDSTDRRVRLAIKKLFKEHGIPFGAVSTQAGYFLIRTSAERDLVKQDFVSRRDQENEMIRLLDNIDLEEEPRKPEPVGQIGLPI